MPVFHFEYRSNACQWPICVRLRRLLEGAYMARIHDDSSALTLSNACWNLTGQWWHCFPHQIHKSTQTLHNQWNTHTNTFWSSSWHVATKNNLTWTWRSLQAGHNSTVLKVICPLFFHLSESADAKLFSVQSSVLHLFIGLQFTCQISHQSASSSKPLLS